MALAATTVWEVRTAGSDTACSGGFVAGGGGTDYSQQNAAQYTGTNLVIDGAVNTKVTSATHNFVAADVGNLMQITAGSGFTTGFFQIVSVSANAATLDRSAGTLGSTAGTFAVGGALATPGLAVANLVAGHVIYASGGYTTTTNSYNVAGGALSFATAGTSTAFVRFIGYTSARGDGGRYTITHGATFTAALISTGSNYNDIHNLAIVGNAAANAAAVYHTAAIACYITNLKVSGYSGSSGSAQAVEVASNAMLKDFEISGGAFTAALKISSSSAHVTDGLVHGNAGIGVWLSAGNAAVFRVASTDHTTGSGYGFYINGDTTFIGCDAWGNAATDYFFVSAVGVTCIRCVSGGSGGYNWDNLTGADLLNLYYCAAKTNTTALYRTTPTVNVGFVTLTGDPFTSRATGDFSPNNIAGGGAALRSVTEVLFGLTTTYADIGLAEHQEAIVATSYIRQAAMRGGGG